MPKPGQILTACIDAMRHSTEFSHGDRKALLKRLDMAATRGVKFTSPKTLTFDRDKPVLLSDLRPPYPVTVLEGRLFGDDGFNALVIARDTGEAVELNFVTHVDNDWQSIVKGWLVAPMTCRILYSDSPMHEPCDVESKPLLPDRLREVVPDHTFSGFRPLIWLYAAVCQILANHEVELQDVLPDAKEARSRKIRGKAPLFTYKTLVIGAPKKRAVERSGGTHASPRSHLRRGYYRTSKKGVRHWVQACMVKGETPGFVHKDYHIEQQEGLRP